MKTKFNHKNFQGRNRIYTELKQYPRVTKLWVWDDEKKQYDCPQRGKVYCARKYVEQLGARKRVYAYFEKLDEALAWQRKIDGELEKAPQVHVDTSDTPLQTFADVLNSWKLTDFTKLKVTTQSRYSQLIGKCFESLMKVDMLKFNSRVVDLWITELLAKPRTSRRIGFKHELDLLSAVLRYHCEHVDGFIHPIKKRHKKDVMLPVSLPARRQHLSSEELDRFLAKLEERKNGHLYRCMATVQFFQALRISEVAALFGRILM